MDPKVESMIRKIEEVTSFTNQKIEGFKSDVYICENCKQIGLAERGKPIGQHPPLVNDCAETIIKNIMES